MHHIYLKKFRQFTFCLAFSAVSFMLVSCASVQQQQTPEPVAKKPVVKRPATTKPVTWAADLEKRASIMNWEIRGRLGVQTRTEGGSLDLIWKQSGRDYSIQLIAPLGAGNYYIQGDDTFAEILFPDGYRKTVDNIEDVFSEVLHVDLPASAINDWVRGIPARSMPVKSPRWDENGLLTNVVQSGWKVEMNKYTGSSILLPHAIYLSRDDDDDLDIRLVLRQWLIDN